MRRRPRSGTNRPIFRNLAAEVFPYRTASSSTSMPSVGARRSTRVFVPKTSATSQAQKPRKPLRASLPDRRVNNDDSDWLPLAWWRQDEGKKRCAGAGVAGWHKSVSAPPVVPPVSDKVKVYSRKSVEQELNSGKFKGLIYSRKRERRSKFQGIVYTRRKKPRLVLEDAAVEHGDDVIVVSARNFARELVGVAEWDVLFPPDDPLAIAVIVHPSCRGGGIDRFASVLVAVAKWMRRPRAAVWKLAQVLFSKSLAGVFSLQGIEFLPVQQSKIDDLSRNAGYGICKIYNAGYSVPLLSVDFGTLPLFFKDLHFAMALGSLCLSGILLRYLMDASRLEDDRCALVPLESEGSPLKCRAVSNQVASPSPSVLCNVTVPSETPVVASNAFRYAGEVPDLVAMDIAFGHSSTLQNYPKKKRKMRDPKSRARIDRNILTSVQSTCPSIQNSMEPISVKLLDVSVGDMGRGDDDTTSPCGTLRSRKFEGTAAMMKSALTDMKQNIDSVRCDVNILVTTTDRCWREEDAELMLELSDSREWCIAVKVHDNLRYLHKPQEWRPCAVNRLNHTYMWGWEDGWKIEFYDKWDWAVFKELHAECRERNAVGVPMMIIPIPGVQEVSEYEDIVPSTFRRPDMYISMSRDEVERAVASEHASYDMDSGDEEWLKQTGSSLLDLEGNNGSVHISEDIFEKIIFALEKETYNSPNEIPDKERAIDLCQNLGGKDIVTFLYEYWLKKRNKRRTSLVKVFQGPPLTSTHFIEKPHLRKKRSLTRQRSQARRGKPEFYLQVGAEQEAKRRVQEAENAATRAVEAAICQRSRAQMLLEHAELAAYKSTMALRIAEAKRVSGTTDLDLASVVLD